MEVPREKLDHLWELITRRHGVSHRAEEVLGRLIAELETVKQRIRKPSRCGGCRVLEGQVHKRWCTLEKKGRFVEKPLMCDRCGVLHPDRFHVSNRAWWKYVGDPDRLLCINCFREIKRLVEKHNGGAPQRVKVKWWAGNLSMELDLSDVPEPYLETSQGGGWSFYGDQAETWAERKK